MTSCKRYILSTTQSKQCTYCRIDKTYHYLVYYSGQLTNIWRITGIREVCINSAMQVKGLKTKYEINIIVSFFNQYTINIIILSFIIMLHLFSPQAMSWYLGLATSGNPLATTINAYQDQMPSCCLVTRCYPPGTNLQLGPSGMVQPYLMYVDCSLKLSQRGLPSSVSSLNLSPFKLFSSASDLSYRQNNQSSPL